METIRKEGDKIIITETKEVVREITKEQLQREIAMLNRQIEMHQTQANRVQSQIDEKQAYLDTHFK